MRKNFVRKFKWITFIILIIILTFTVLYSTGLIQKMPGALTSEEVENDKKLFQDVSKIIFSFSVPNNYPGFETVFYEMTDQSEIASFIELLRFDWKSPGLCDHSNHLEIFGKSITEVRYSENCFEIWVNGKRHHYIMPSQLFGKCMEKKRLSHKKL